MMKVFSDTDLEQYLDDLDEKVEPLDEAIQWSLWHKYLGKPAKNLLELEKRRADILLDSEVISIIDEWLPKTKGLINRKLELWKNLIITTRLRDDTRISEIRNNIFDQLVDYQAESDDRIVSRADVREILRSNPKQELRRKAWEAFVPLGNIIESELRELITCRTQMAEAMGYSSYEDISLSLNGLDPKKVLNLVNELDKVTRPIFEYLIEQGSRKLGISVIHPWDIDYILNNYATQDEKWFRRSAMKDELMKFRENIGVPAHLPIELVFGDVPFGGLTNFLNIPNDIRILMNPSDGYAYYSTLFHEYGHAVHHTSITIKSFILKKEKQPSGAIPFSEAMAETMAFFVSDSAWLETITGLSGSKQKDLMIKRLAMFVLWLRRLMAVVEFEYLAYADPKANLDEILAKSEKKFLLNGHLVEGRWASDPFYIQYPIYRQNYLVADVVAAQVHEAMRRDLGTIYPNRKVYDWLREAFYAPGATLPWKILISNKTGLDFLDIGPIKNYIDELSQEIDK